MEIFDIWAENEPAPGIFRNLIGRPDGAMLQQDEHGALYLLFLMSNPTDKEIRLVKHGRIETARYDVSGYWMGLFRFVDSPATSFDVSFDITQYAPEQREARIKALSITNVFQIALIDTDNAVVKALRLVSIPQKFIDSLRISVSQQKGEFSEGYDWWLNNLYQRSFDAAWRKATKTGVMGQSDEN